MKSSVQPMVTNQALHPIMHCTGGKQNDPSGVQKCFELSISSSIQNSVGSEEEEVMSGWIQT